MNERLLLGRSIETGSWVHRLDPKSKLIGMVLYAAVILLCRSWADMALLAVFSVLVMLSTRIPLKYYLKAAKPLKYLMIFIFVIQALTVKTGAVYVDLGPLRLHEDGLRLGSFAVIRTFFLITFTALLTFTTRPSRLNQGLEGLLKPLRRIGIPAERLTLMMSLALRFIPTILDEAQVILKAQASRGADLSELKLADKARMLITLLVPVIAGAFRRAQDLIYSMEARGFVLDAPRSQYHRLRWRLADSAFIALFLAAGVAVALL